MLLVIISSYTPPHEPHPHSPQPFLPFTDVFLGPVEAYVLAPVARFSGAWNVPLLTPGGQPNAFDKRKDYPLLTRLKGFYTEVSRVAGETSSGGLHQLLVQLERWDPSQGSCCRHLHLEAATRYWGYSDRWAYNASKTEAHFGLPDLSPYMLLPRCVRLKLRRCLTPK